MWLLPGICGVEPRRNANTWVVTGRPLPYLLPLNISLGWSPTSARSLLYFLWCRRSQRKSLDFPGWLCFQWEEPVAPPSLWASQVLTATHVPAACMQHPPGPTAAPVFSRLWALGDCLPWKVIELKKKGRQEGRKEGHVPRYGGEGGLL
jgi:hypothetical protein